MLRLSACLRLASSLVLAWCLLAPLTAPLPGTRVAPAAAAPLATGQAPLSARYGELPLSFIANAGQSDPAAAFEVRGADSSLVFGASQLNLNALRHPASASWSAADPAALPASAAVEVTFPGARPGVVPTGTDPLPGTANFFLGDDPAAWRTGVPTFAAVRYVELYPGIDLLYRGQGGSLKSEWVVAPGAVPAAIRIHYGGDVAGLSLDAAGALHVATSQGDLVEAAPEVYQTIDGQRAAVASRYVLVDERTVAFSLGAYDAGEPLVIDPALLYSTFLGISSNAKAIAADAAGDAYLAGNVASASFPTTPGAFQTTLRGVTNAFVTKLNPTGTALVYSTFLGGSGQNGAEGIAVDAAGNAYLTGSTDAQNFPTTPGAFQTTGPTTPGAADAFITKLNPTGTGLVYSTYFGGSQTTLGQGIAVDAAGNAYLTGETNAPNLPVLNAFQPTYGGGVGGGAALFGDAFVTKLNPAGTALVYSSYLGGSSGDGGIGIALDAASNAYVSGSTGSENFPTTPGAFQRTFAGGLGDAFVTKVTAAGTLGYSTYLGGSFQDIGGGIAVDDSGSAYIAGATSSVNFPSTPGAFQPALKLVPGVGSQNAFVSKLNPAGSALTYSTFLGGFGVQHRGPADEGFGIAVDSGGNAYVVGSTNSSDFPTLNAFQLEFAGDQNHSNAFVTAFNAAGSGLLYSSFLGGSGASIGTTGFAIALDPAGNAYLAGITDQSTFPTTPGVVQPTYLDGFSNAFAAKVGAAGLAGGLGSTPVVPELPPLWLFGSGLLLLAIWAGHTRRR